MSVRGVTVHVCNPRIPEVKERGPEVQGHPKLHTELSANVQELKKKMVSVSGASRKNTEQQLREKVLSLINVQSTNITGDRGWR